MRPLRVLSRLFLFLEDWILPPVCVHCGLRRRASLPLCRTCLRALRDSRPEEDEAVSGLPWVRSLFRMTPPLHDLIHGFKYRHQRRHIAFLAEWLRWRRAWLEDLGRSYDALIPVPLHAARRRDRGYNQAERLAGELARQEARGAGLGRRGGRPVRTRGLKRLRFTGTQTRLKSGARAGNLEGAFRADPGLVAGQRILLIDDVCTTGSTLSHCREALLAAGAARVDALTLAWVEKRMNPRPGDLEAVAGFFS
ncbi:MAG: utilization protein GntX [Fibrobacteria bacterium]|jgi:ComF family protein|nr:utilization protein GntX [Fibrobacteria bacterium]